MSVMWYSFSHPQAGSGNQGVEKEIVPFTITPSDLLGKFLLPVPAMLSSVPLHVETIVAIIM